VGPTATGPLISRPDRGRPTLNGWWAPVTLRNIKEVGAAGSGYEVRRQPHIPPPTFPDGKLRRRRHCLDRRCPSADLHFASLPSRKSPTWPAVPAAPLPETVHLPSPLSLFIHALHMYIHTVTVGTRLDPHLVDPLVLSPSQSS
jgi:hypothetical protein